MPAVKEKERATAERLFVEDGWTAKAIAELLDVQEKTISGWRTKGEWDVKRGETLASPHKIKQLLIKEIVNVSEGKDPTIDADGLSKLSKVLEAIQDRINPQIIISVIKLLDDWLAERDPKVAASMLDAHKQFILHSIQTYG